MGNKHTKSSNVLNNYSGDSPNGHQNGTKFSLKRRLNNNNNNNKYSSSNMNKSTSTMNLNRSSTSPVVAKWRFSTVLNSNDENSSPVNQNTKIDNSKLKHIQLDSSPMSNLKSSNNRVIDLNRQLKSNQQNLTNAIKTINQQQQQQQQQLQPKPSYQVNNNSKLYKPNSSLLLATTNKPLATKQVATTKHPQHQHELLNNNMYPSPMNQKQQIPAQKNNSIFSHSRLLQALQSQLNLFTSMRMNKTNGEDDNDYENDDTDSIKAHKNNILFQNKSSSNNRTDTTATFLSTSLQRNSFRYASRRKYKTQSLANPYRHGQTNYPVYIHEALFMPEFSVKGQVTEADFEILDVISRGAFGHVIKVKKKLHKDENGVGGGNCVIDDNQIYAMKIMWKSQVIRDRALQQVKDEVTIAISCVDNPLIVKTWFYWQSKRFLYIITDFVENGELLSLWLKVHHFPERLVILYAVEMCLILDYLHKRGIIYRDIKMENILLDQRGHVQLIDFGLSKWLNLGQRTGTICGTIQYMAPEILSVEPYDHAVDWWSLGILIYALLSGEYPLNAAKDHIQMNEKVSKHIFELDQSEGKYSPEACDLVRKLLRKNPQRRLKSLNEIKHESFFQKEVNRFIDMCLEQEKQQKANYKKMPSSNNSNMSEEEDDEYSDDNSSLDELDKKKMISENFWNPYVIIQNYSPLQMLFDEIYAMKQRQKILKQMEKEKALKNKKRQEKIVSSATVPTPPPPPPPLQIPKSTIPPTIITSTNSTEQTETNQSECENKIKLIKASQKNKLPANSISSSNSTTLTTSTPSTSHGGDVEYTDDNCNYLIDEIIIVESDVKNENHDLILHNNETDETDESHDYNMEGGDFELSQDDQDQIEDEDKNVSNSTHGSIQSSSNNSKKVHEADDYDDSSRKNDQFSDF